MNDENEQSLENLINNALDESVQELAPEIQHRLTPMRVIASQAADKPSRFSNSWKLATAFTVVVAVSVSWNMWQQVEVNSLTSTFASTEISPFDEVLEEDLDMLTELEFVYWMAEENLNENLNEKNSETAIL